MKHGESGGPEPLTFTHNGQPATVDLERFTRQPQKEIHMKHGEIGAPRKTGDVGVAPEPSQADRTLTTTLKNALNMIGTQTLDHIVVGHEGCVSLAERGYL